MAAPNSADGLLLLLFFQFVLFCVVAFVGKPDQSMSLIQQWRQRKLFRFEAPVDAGEEDETERKQCPSNAYYLQS